LGGPSASEEANLQHHTDLLTRLLAEAPAAAQTGIERAITASASHGPGAPPDQVTKANGPAGGDQGGDRGGNSAGSQHDSTSPAPSRSPQPTKSPKAAPSAPSSAEH